MDNDLISRSDLLNVKPKFLNEKVVCDTKYQTTKNRVYAKAWNDCNDCWIDTIENALTVERPQGEWIPVSERLPEKIGTYLVTLEYKEHGQGITTLWYHGEGIGWDLRVADVVTAWQPLPEPYKKEGKEE